jgi:hypothetical protein
VKKAVAANKYTSVADNFDGYGGAPVQYGAHSPIQHNQGFTGSYCMPPSGNYLPRISSAAARATANKTMM